MAPRSFSISRVTTTPMVIRDVCVLALCAALVSSACSEPTGGGNAGPPATISIVSGDNQSALAGTTVPTPVVAQVRDKQGRGVPGVGVVFTIFEGSGSVASNAPVNTDASGNATGAATLDSIIRPDHGGNGAARLLLQTCDGENHRWMIYADLVTA